MSGLRFIFTPADSNFSFDSIVAAMGQVFYSLSLGMGITITYGSYLRRSENIPRSCATVAGLDTMAAVFAGIAIFPAVFAFNLEPAQGPGLIFGTLPNVFGNMPAGDSIFRFDVFCGSDIGDCPAGMRCFLYNG